MTKTSIFIFFLFAGLISCKKEDAQISSVKTYTYNELKPLLESLEIEIQECNQEKIRKLLIHLVPEFQPQCGIVDILYQKEKFNAA